MTQLAAAPNTPLTYLLGGLQIRSQIPLPELTPMRSLSTDLDIKLSRLPENLIEPQWHQYGVQVKDQTALLIIPGIARYLIEDGQTIHVDPAPDATAPDVRLFLLGTAFGIACHQRGAFPLHASAIVEQHRAIAFVGPSGAGKSTLGAWLSQAGYPLLCDDVCILRPDPNTAPQAYSGSPRIKLWKDALAAIGIDHTSLQRDLTRIDKYHLTLKQTHTALSAPLQAIYSLSAEDAPLPDIKGPLDPLDAIATIADNTYRQELIQPLGQSSQHFNACAEIARRVPVYRLLRPRTLDAMNDVIACLQQHWTLPEHTHASSY